MAKIIDIFSKNELSDNEIKNNKSSPNFNGTIISLWDLNKTTQETFLHILSFNSNKIEKLTKYIKTEDISPNFNPKNYFALVIYFKSNKYLWDFFNTNILNTKIKNKFYSRFDERDLQKLEYKKEK